MNIAAVLVTGLFFLFIIQPSWSAVILSLILCIPVYMLATIFLPTGGRAPSNTRQGGDQNANSGETKL